MHTCCIDLEPDPARSHHAPPARVATRAGERLAGCRGVEHLSTRVAGDRIRFTAFLDATGPVAALPLIADLRARLGATVDLGGWRLVPDGRSRP